MYLVGRAGRTPRLTVELRRCRVCEQTQTFANVPCWIAAVERQVEKLRGEIAAGYFRIG